MIKVQQVTNTSLKTAAQQREAFQEILGGRTDIGRQMLKFINSVDQNVKTAGKTNWICAATDRVR
jgi:hypothetical protein